MYSKRSNLILGFHGCDEEVAKSIISREKTMKPSSNDYDWLGPGFYFWENNIKRAFLYAEELKEKSNNTNKPNKIVKSAVIGAIIDLGYCLDLLDSENLQLLKSSYNIFRELCIKENLVMPVNRSPENTEDLLVRNLDCAVIQNIHALNKINGIQRYDSVRGVFWEGSELYPNAGFKEKNHIQICVCNPNCIKGLFLPLELSKDYHNP